MLHCSKAIVLCSRGCCICFLNIREETYSKSLQCGSLKLKLLIRQYNSYRENLAVTNGFIYGKCVF